MRHLLLLGYLSLATITPLAAEEPVEIPFGPVGGVLRMSEGESFLRVASLQENAPGFAAGLRPDDLIISAEGRRFAVPDSPYQGYRGPVDALGRAIDEVEGTDGILDLEVLRLDGSRAAVKVHLPVLGALGPVFGRGTKYTAMRDRSCAYLAKNPQFLHEYVSPFAGLALISHREWKTTYAPALQVIRARAIKRVNNSITMPLLPGAPGYAVPPYLENWYLSAGAIFLAAWSMKSPDDVAARQALQLAVVKIANRVQLQNPVSVGHMGHQGIEGDYNGNGINAIGVQAFTALSWAMQANAWPTSEPERSRIEERYSALWSWLQKCTTYNGAVGYESIETAGSDGELRNSGTLVGYFLRHSLEPGWAEVPADADFTARLLAREVVTVPPRSVTNDDYQRLVVDRTIDQAYLYRHNHYYTIGGAVFTSLLAPYLSARDQDYLARQWRHNLTLMRQPDGSLTFLNVRLMYGDSGIDSTDVAHLEVAFPGAVVDGLLPGLAKPAEDALHLEITAPGIDWPVPRAKLLCLLPSTTSLGMALHDGLGLTIPSQDTRIAWTQVSGPAPITFDRTDAATIQASFKELGVYEVQVRVEVGTRHQTDVVRVLVERSPHPPLVRGSLDYEVYRNQAGSPPGIPGSRVVDLTSHPTFINHQPDQVSTLGLWNVSGPGTNFGSRLSGFIVPPKDGDYTFPMSVDFNAGYEFRLNPLGPDAVGTKVIGGRNPATPDQSVHLLQGIPYRFEFLHKVGAVGSNFINGFVNHVDPLARNQKDWLDGNLLARPGMADALDGVATPRFDRQPGDAAVHLGDSVTLSVQARGQGLLLYVWLKDGVIFQAPSSSPAITLTNCNRAMAGSWQCRVMSTTGTALSNAAQVSILDSDRLIPGGLWQELFPGLTSTAISFPVNHHSVQGLVQNDIWPFGTTSSGSVDRGLGVFWDRTMVPPVRLASHDWGERLSGWLLPTVDGDYTLYLAGNESAELWLSTDDRPEHRRLLINFRLRTDTEGTWNTAYQSTVTLVGGSSYHLEILHRSEGDGHVALSWKKPGDPPLAAAQVAADGTITDLSAVEGQYLAYRQGGSGQECHLPVAMPDTYTVPVGKPTVVPALRGPLANDRFFHGRAGATFRVVTPPKVGTVLASPDGGFTYTPPAAKKPPGTVVTFDYEIQQPGNIAPGFPAAPWMLTGQRWCSRRMLRSFPRFPIR